MSDREGAYPSRMLEEAADAARVIAGQLETNHERMQALGAALRAWRPRAVITCARGSSDHAATYARYLIETRAGVLTSSAPPSVASLYRTRTGFDRTVLVAISQSGASPDLLATAAAARAGGARVLALVNVEDSPLAALADQVVPLCAGAERSVAATKSFLASLAAVVHLTACWTEDAELQSALSELPRQLTQAWTLEWHAALGALSGASSCYVIGRGLGLGIAMEIALKLKETCGLHAEALSAAEVRHGPLALVGAGFPVIVLAQHDVTQAGVVALATEMAERGARILIAGAGAAGATELPTVRATAAIEPVLMAQSFYRLAHELAVDRGRDPDRPPHLAKVTETL